MRHAAKALGLLVGLVFVAACTPQPKVNNFPELTFQHADKINLDVASVEIVEAYQSQINAPYVDTEMPVRLMQAASNWANNVIKATGQSGTAKVTISEASVKEEHLKKKDGVEGLLTTDQSERYLTKLTLRIEVQDVSGSRANTSGTVTRSITVPEDITLIEREKVWFTLVEKTANDMNNKMQQNVRQYLSSYLSN